MEISDLVEFKSQHRGGFHLKPQSMALDVVFMEQIQLALV